MFDGLCIEMRSWILLTSRVTQVATVLTTRSRSIWRSRIDTLSIQGSSELDTAPWCIEPQGTLRLIHHKEDRNVDLVLARHLEDVIVVLECISVGKLLEAIERQKS